MWRALKRGYQAEPLLISVSFGLALLAALPDALMALWLKYLADGVLAGQRGLVMTAALGLGFSSVATWFLRVISDRTQRRFRDKVTIALESHVARLQASVATIEHHERPEYLDRLSVLRDQIFVLDHMYMSLFSTCAWILRLAVTIALLASIHPALVLLAVFAVPTVLTSTWRPGVERAVEERGAPSNRLARHLFELATTAPPGKEVRVTRIGAHLAARRRQAWEQWYGPVAAARRSSAIWYAAGWAIFGAAYVSAVVFVASILSAGPSAVLLVLAAGSRLSAYVAATVGEIGFLRGIWLDGSVRLAWLEDYAASKLKGADAPAPERLDDGIRFEHVSFAYPGTQRLVLDDINLKFQPGSVVAIVGENGAGKTTLVKLLCGLYPPSSGRILVDGLELARISPDAWRARLAGAFQDFFRFEFKARHTVGLGDLPRVNDQPAVAAPSSARALSMSSTSSQQVLKHSLVRHGPTAPRSVLGSGRSSRSHGDSCARALWFSCSTNLPLLSMLRPSTLCSSVTLRPHVAGAPALPRPTAASRSWFPTGSAPCAWPISLWSSTAHAWSKPAPHEELLAKGGQYAELYRIQAAAYR